VLRQACDTLSKGDFQQLLAALVGAKGILAPQPATGGKYGHLARVMSWLATEGTGAQTEDAISSKQAEGFFMPRRCENAPFRPNCR
jgi:hypothetical protein